MPIADGFDASGTFVRNSSCHHEDSRAREGVDRGPMAPLGVGNDTPKLSFRENFCHLAGYHGLAVEAPLPRTSIGDGSRSSGIRGVDRNRDRDTDPDPDSGWRRGGPYWTGGDSKPELGGCWP